MTNISDTQLLNINQKFDIERVDLHQPQIKNGDWGDLLV